MPEKGIPKNIEEFINKYINSTEDLEILLLILNEPEKEWTVELVFNKILTSRESVARCLEKYSKEGLIEAIYNNSITYKFKTQNKDTTDLLKNLSTIYKHQMHHVINLIYSKPISTIQSFADAFRLRKE